MMRPIAVLRRHGAVATGLLAQVLQYGAALALLPFIVTRLNEAQVAIWYIFVTIQGLVLLADFGFQPTIGRAVASAYAGVSELQREGLSTVEGRTANLPLVKGIILTARRLYFAMAAAVLAVLITFGTIYVTRIVAGQDVDLGQVRLAWFLCALGTAANLYFLWIAPLLIGSGRVAQNYIITIINRGGFALLGIIVLLAGGGLVALAGANLAAVLIARSIAVLFLRPIEQSLVQVPVTRSTARKVLFDLWPNAWRLGLVALGAFAINRSNMLILSSLVSLPTSARYAITLQLFSAVAAVSQLPTQAALPQMIALRVQGDVAGLRRVFLSRQLFLLISFVLGAGFLLFLGQPLLSLVGSKVRLLDRVDMALFALILLLETNHSNAAIVITTANRVPFVWPGLLSGVGVVGLSIAAALSGFGVMGVILSQGLVQAVYNNWRWPLMLWKELRS